MFYFAVSFFSDISESIQTNVHTDVDFVPSHLDDSTLVQNMKGFTLEKSLINVPNVDGHLPRRVICKIMKISVVVNVPINAVSVNNLLQEKRVAECMKKFV